MTADGRPPRLLVKTLTVTFVTVALLLATVTSRGTEREQLLETVDRELDRLAARVEADAIVLVDTRQNTLTAKGPLAARYFTRLFYGRTTWDRQAGVQLVWSRRWW